MPITIDEPRIENWLQQEASKRGLTADEYARSLLELHHPVEGQQSVQPQEVPGQAADGEEATEYHAHDRGSLAAITPTHQVTPDEWTQAFDTWVDSHAVRDPLPPEAFPRASFYPEPA